MSLVTEQLYRGVSIHEFAELLENGVVSAKDFGRSPSDLDLVEDELHSPGEKMLSAWYLNRPMPERYKDMLGIAFHTGAHVALARRIYSREDRYDEVLLKQIHRKFVDGVHVPKTLVVNLITDYTGFKTAQSFLSFLNDAETLSLYDSRRKVLMRRISAATDEQRAHGQTVAATPAGYLDALRTLADYVAVEEATVGASAPSTLGTGTHDERETVANDLAILPPSKRQ
jgi:hypothetical protein